MNGEVIKSFLVGLGFGVDDNSLAKFNKAISNASLRVTALYASVQAAAAGIFWSISQISEGFEQMGYEYRIIAPAINKALVLRRELLAAYRAAGINITKTVIESVKFNMSLAKTKFALEAIYKSVGVKFLPLLTKQMNEFRKTLYANMPRIQEALHRFVEFVFRLFKATTILSDRLFSILGRVWDLFKKLDEATDGWSTKIIGFIAVWKLLNLTFLTTPLGMVLAGLVAILALWDDFQTFKEGGKSLFDWSAAQPVLESLWKILTSIVDALGAVWAILRSTENWDGSKLATGIERLARAFQSLNSAMDTLVGSLGFNALNNLLAWRNRVDNSVLSFFGGGSGQFFDPKSFASPPVDQSRVQNSNSSTLHQQTSIVVQGSADANSTAKGVASEQGRLNFDTIRNMKGATR